MKSRKTFSRLFVALLACAALLAVAQKQGAAAAAAAGMAPDRGRFAIQLGGQTIGHEEFEISPMGGGWKAKGTTSLKAGEGAETKISGDLVIQQDGSPVSYDWTAQTDKTNGAHISFSNGVASITLQMQGAHLCTPDEIKDPNRKTSCFFQQDLSFDNPRIAVLDNNLYHQYAVLARLYDWSKRGAQTFPVLIPQELTPGTITTEATGSASSGGKTYEGLKINTTDVEILLLLDSSHRLMRLEVPTANVAVIRE
jgi:hypothetical protein